MQNTLYNLEFTSRIHEAVSRVTAAELNSLPGGGVPNKSDEYSLTGQYLTHELKVLWTLFLREVTPYLEVKAAYDQLSPAEVNYVAFDALLAAESRVKTNHQYFWINFKVQFDTVCRGHYVVGFDQNFQVWVSTALRRSVQKPSILFIPYQYCGW